MVPRVAPANVAQDDAHRVAQVGLQNQARKMLKELMQHAS